MDLRNILQSLMGQRQPEGMPAASMPMQPQQPAMPIQQPQMQGDLQQMTSGAPDNSRMAEMMQAIGGAPDTAPVQMPEAQPEQPRQRRSILETIGRISDVIAQVGGAQAMYQPTLDAREDRARGIDIEAMRKQMLGQQIEQGGQALEAGEMEMAGSQRAMLANALGAIATNPDAAAMWPQIAQQAGIDEQTAQAVGAIIQQNPQAAGVFAQSLGWTPGVKGQGSQAKEAQIYQMLSEEGGPEMGQAYLQSLTNPDSMTEYQRAQLGLSMGRLDLDRMKAAQEGAEQGSPAASLTPGQKKLDQAFGSVYNDYVARGGFADVQKGINQLKEVRTQLEDGGVTGGVSGYLPTTVRSLFNEKSVSAQEAVEEVVQRNLRLILGAQFTQKEGERLIERAYNPRLSEEENIKRLDRLIQQLETAATETERAATYFEDNGTLNGWRGNLPGMNTSRPAPRNNSRTPARPPASRGSSPAPRRSMSPNAVEARRRGLID